MKSPWMKHGWGMGDKVTLTPSSSSPNSIIFFPFQMLQHNTSTWFSIYGPPMPIYPCISICVGINNIQIYIYNASIYWMYRAPHYPDFGAFCFVCYDQVAVTVGAVYNMRPYGWRDHLCTWKSHISICGDLHHIEQPKFITTHNITLTKNNSNINFETRALFNIYIRINLSIFSLSIPKCTITSTPLI